MVNGPLYHRSAAESSQPQKKQEKELKNQKDWEKKEKDAIKKFKVSKCIIYIYIYIRGDPELSAIQCFDRRSLIRLPISQWNIRGVLWSCHFGYMGRSNVWFHREHAGYLCNHGYIHTITQLVGRRQPMTSLPAKPQYKRAPGEYFIHFFVWSLRPKHGTVPRGRSVSFPTRGTIVRYVTWDIPLHRNFELRPLGVAMGKDIPTPPCRGEWKPKQRRALSTNSTRLRELPLGWFDGCQWHYSLRPKTRAAFLNNLPVKVELKGLESEEKYYFKGIWPSA